jgi:hypothetical protein
LGTTNIRKSPIPITKKAMRTINEDRKNPKVDRLTGEARAAAGGRLKQARARPSQKCWFFMFKLLFAAQVLMIQFSIIIY